MAEVFRVALTTPLRLQAVLKLLALLGDKPREEIQTLLQPGVLSNNQNTSREVINLLKNLGMVIETEPEGQLSLAEDVPRDIAKLESYRCYMQSNLLGITDPNAPNNYVLNQFAAWFAVQDDRIAQTKLVDLTARFNEQLYPAETGGAANGQTRTMNETKFNGWRNWAAFLGWGLTHDAFQSGFVPDANLRVGGLLETLLPVVDELVPMRAFMDTLAKHCPELDGGNLFEDVWVLSRPTEERGNRLSLMLSTGLRVLARCGKVELIDMADAGDLWQLFPVQGGINRISHIKRERA